LCPPAAVLGIVKGRWKHRRQTFPSPLSVTQFGLFDYARQIQTEALDVVRDEIEAIVVATGAPRQPGCPAWVVLGHFAGG
jgi:hypothetical protein